MLDKMHFAIFKPRKFRTTACSSRKKTTKRTLWNFHLTLSQNPIRGHAWHRKEERKCRDTTQVFVGGFSLVTFLGKKWHISFTFKLCFFPNLSQRDRYRRTVTHRYTKCQQRRSATMLLPSSVSTEHLDLSTAFVTTTFHNQDDVPAWKPSEGLLTLESVTSGPHSNAGSAFLSKEEQQAWWRFDLTQPFTWLCGE